MVAVIPLGHKRVVQPRQRKEEIVATFVRAMKVDLAIQNALLRARLNLISQPHDLSGYTGRFSTLMHIVDGAYRRLYRSQKNI